MSMQGPFCVCSQWEMALQCNVISHWLGAFTKWSLVHVCTLGCMFSILCDKSLVERTWKKFLSAVSDAPETICIVSVDCCEPQWQGAIGYRALLKGVAINSSILLTKEASWELKFSWTALRLQCLGHAWTKATSTPRAAISQYLVGNHE